MSDFMAQPSWTIIVQHFLHSLLSMELEMGMQLHLLILCQKEHNLVWMFYFGTYDVSVQNLKLQLLTVVMHMATPTRTPIYYTNQTQEIPSTSSEQCL